MPRDTEKKSDRLQHRSPYGDCAIDDGKTISAALCRSSCPLYFGLGDAETIDKITVAWPSGARTSVGPTAANQLIELIETHL